MTTLFDPITLGPVTLSNRIMMAPMTRGRGTDKHVPLPRIADYYAQRAGAGLIISEAIPISVPAGLSRRACGATSRLRPGSR
jgi:N-ethylmaleimide reductase